MKSLLFLINFFLVCGVQAQNLTPEEQRKLLQDVKELKAKVGTLESEKKNTGGLKNTDYQSTTTATTTTGAIVPAAPAISPEQMKEMMDSLQNAKSQQAEKDKVLKQLEEDEHDQ